MTRPARPRADRESSGNLSLLCGQRCPRRNYHPELLGWYIYGQGSVSADRARIVPNPGVQIYELTGAMVGVPSLGPSSGNCEAEGCAEKAGDPVDLGTGLFIYDKTDLVLPDTIPIALTRTYRQNDSRSRAFGIGTTHNYDIFLVGDTTTYNYQELVTASGGRIRFDRTSPGIGFTTAVYRNNSVPGIWYKARISWNGVGWTLSRRDGTVLTFPDSFSVTTPQKAALLSVTDRNGNVLELDRDSGGDLTRITSPNGRWIQFTYDGSHRVTEARDNMGRTVQYTYTSGRLTDVTDAAGGTWEYAYDTSGRMTAITDARSILYLENEYDASGRVSLQTLADDGTWEFDYTTALNGGITRTDVTDPRGHVRRVTFGSMPVAPGGFMSGSFPATVTQALGTALERTMSVTREPGTNLLLGATDPPGRTTAYTYDSLGNVTSVTRLAGTQDAVTTTYTYDGKYSNVTGITDPLGHTTRFEYDLKGNRTAVTDPLGNRSSFSYNTAGQMVTATDANGHTTSFGYSGGHLVSVTDPLGRTTTRIVDAAGPRSPRSVLRGRPRFRSTTP